MIDGYELLELQPDFARAPKLAGRRVSHLMARGQARRLGIFPTGGVQHVLSHRFVFQTRAQAAVLEQFFNDRRGSWQSFFVPGWFAEIEPLQTLAPGDTSLAITAVNFSAVYLSTAKKTLTGRFIYLLANDGTFHTSKVLSATSSSPEILTLRDAIPDGFNFIAGNYHVGFLYHVRFLHDQLVLDFSGPEIAECELPMLELIENGAPINDESHEPEPAPGPDGGSNSESGSSGNAYWLRCECPITSGVNGCPTSAVAEITLPGDIGGPRPVQIHIRGLSENKLYSGGTPDAPFYTGGTPGGGGANIFKLIVGAQVFYINYSLGGAGVFAMNYQRTVTMQAGDVIRLEYNSVDNLEYNNSGHVVVAGVPPAPGWFNGQFAQIDFLL